MLRIGVECESIEGKNSDLPANRQVFGVGKMIIKLLEEISRRPELEKDYHFVLYFKNNIPDLPFLKAPVFETKRVSVPFFKNRLFPIYYFALLPMRLWFDRPDVMFWPNYMLPIIAFGKSMVMLTEDVYYEARAGELPFRYRLAYKIFCWWTAKFATKIMAISETSKGNLVKLYGIEPNRIVVNHLGVDIENHKSQITPAPERSTVRGTTNHKQNPNFLIPNPYLLFVGQMFPRRHAKETVLAFEQLVSNHSQILENLGINNLRLILVGPDKYPEPTIDLFVEQINKRLGRETVIHKNYVEDSELVELYAGAKALVYVSDREAFGLPPMESLSFGVPPIVMDNELGHELFNEYAIYSKSGGAGDIADAIKQVLNEVGSSTVLRTSRLEFVKKYNWKSFANRWLQILQSIK
ncbi:MAG: hypothetical protein A3J46_00980 [Candidatus Yanofskybacteria bacterium RIFCSPHIGHO2_02_FULL_41_11]|uniref:Glycosyl transferase family 1 domain-containing protein n=1 Tax=Candidatus Yanofskybacteria bacterium RIFCSPHIGHO2_02_FULL_41_11 TaxID=1802675 RepID=A0A1F8F7G0_9BACT|nr:MAG: hypothetical protein A3J46_00980 [Candidatus Yanofskybacteria bacterium RIFCSPHIGHO2_02_FULL_41_11]